MRNAAPISPDNSEMGKNGSARQGEKSRNPQSISSYKQSQMVLARSRHKKESTAK